MRTNHEMLVSRRTVLEVAGAGLVAVQFPGAMGHLVDSFASPPPPDQQTLDIEAGIASNNRLISTARDVLKSRGATLSPSESGIPTAQDVLTLGKQGDTIGLSLTGNIPAPEGAYQILSVGYSLYGDPKKSVNIIANSRDPFTFRINNFFPDFEFPENPGEHPGIIGLDHYYAAMEFARENGVDITTLRQGIFDGFLLGEASDYDEVMRTMLGTDKLEYFHDGFRIIANEWVPDSTIPLIDSGAQGVMELIDALPGKGEVAKSLGGSVVSSLEQLAEEAGVHEEIDMLDQGSAEEFLMSGGETTVFELPTGEIAEETVPAEDAEPIEDQMIDTENDTDVSTAHEPIIFARFFWRKNKKTP